MHEIVSRVQACCALQMHVVDSRVESYRVPDSVEDLVARREHGPCALNDGAHVESELTCWGEHEDARDGACHQERPRGDVPHNA